MKRVNYNKPIYSVTSDVGKITGAKCDTITFTPHCNGTYTEGVGHIVEKDIAISSVIEGEEGQFDATLSGPSIFTPELVSREDIISRLGI